jgi:hypothetical protein
MKLKTIAFAFAAIATLAACIPEPDQPSAPLPDCYNKPKDNCINPSYTYQALALCIDDNENLTWSNACWNKHCQTSFEPASGTLCVRCDFPLCQNPCPATTSSAPSRSTISGPPSSNSSQTNASLNPSRTACTSPSPVNSAKTKSYLVSLILAPCAAYSHGRRPLLFH